MCEIFITDRILRQRLIIEEYGTDLEYIQGNKKRIAYAL